VVTSTGDPPGTWMVRVRESGPLRETAGRPHHARGGESACEAWAFGASLRSLRASSWMSPIGSPSSTMLVVRPGSAAPDDLASRSACKRRLWREGGTLLSRETPPSGGSRTWGARRAAPHVYCLHEEGRERVIPGILPVTPAVNDAYQVLSYTHDADDSFPGRCTAQGIQELLTYVPALRYKTPSLCALHMIFPPARTRWTSPWLRSWSSMIILRCA
jgi:hypothetical protein